MLLFYPDTCFAAGQFSKYSSVVHILKKSTMVFPPPLPMIRESYSIYRNSAESANLMRISVMSDQKTMGFGYARRPTSD